jgi:hypothetical protein
LIGQSRTGEPGPLHARIADVDDQYHGEFNFLHVPPSAQARKDSIVAMRSG